jgi:hypothetical protein
MSQFYVGTSTGSLPPVVPVQFTTDNAEIAIPSGGNLNIFGSPGVETSASGSTITISLTNVVTQYTNVTGPTTYDVQPTDYFISCGTAGGPCTIRLPNSPTLYQTFIIKDRTGSALPNKVILTTVGGVVLIDNVTTYSFTDDFESTNVLFNGTSYETF